MTRSPLPRSRRMGRLLAALLGVAAASPSFACDPEAMSAELARVCDGALLPARAAIEAVLPEATEAERATIAGAITRAAAACDVGDPMQGAAEAVRLARLAGRIEARTGALEPIWPDRLVSATSAPQQVAGR